MCFGDRIKMLRCGLTAEPPLDIVHAGPPCCVVPSFDLAREHLPAPLAIRKPNGRKATLSRAARSSSGNRPRRRNRIDEVELLQILRVMESAMESPIAR